MPTRRFAVAASWFCTLLREALKQEAFGALALKRTMKVSREKLHLPNLPTTSFDASPWRGGGILWQAGRAVKYMHVWDGFSLKVFKAERGSSDYQTSFEYLTLFMVAVTFDEELATTGALIRGDNLGALNDALRLKSTASDMNGIGRELAWRRVFRRWQYLLNLLKFQ